MYINLGGILSSNSNNKHIFHAIKDNIADATTTTTGASSSSSSSSSDKLVFDKESNRFFEADTSSVLEEEFCLIDKETGE